MTERALYHFTDISFGGILPVLGLKKYFPTKHFLSEVMGSNVDLKRTFSFYDTGHAIFSLNEVSEPNVQNRFLGCNQVARINAVRENTLAELLEG